MYSSKCEREENLVRIIQPFLERGADVDARRMDHDTPLHLASSYGRLEVARLYLEHGADANAKVKLIGSLYTTQRRAMRNPQRMGPCSSFYWNVARM